ncbi:pyridoxamine 5'-phosphate oxidase family protein [Streptomyces shenzhenensis]|uniref:pyridoxamine 5'-phosphate oxidase family protein n=1 Tax=Streptomyces shenzhenensis TaxID=943815 RepID=UPI0034095E61
MPAQEPSVEEVEKSIKELLRDEPVATLATLDSDGNPATSHMHYGADGLRVYMLTFGYTRKHAEIDHAPESREGVPRTAPTQHMGPGTRPPRPATRR